MIKKVIKRHMIEAGRWFGGADGPERHPPSVTRTGQGQLPRRLGGVRYVFLLGVGSG